MTDSATVEELDLALVSALQNAPRASWAVVAKAVEISPVTAARRWERLRAQGLAWVTAYGGSFVHRHHCVAFVGLDCEPGRIPVIAAELARHPQISSVEHTSGPQDLLLNVMVDGLADLSRMHTDVLGRLPGVRAVHSAIVTHFFTEGSRWDLRAISREQRDVVRPPVAQAGDSDPVPADGDRELLIALGADGRMGYGELARRAGMSESTARRRVSRLLTTRTVVPRCELAHSFSPYPVFVTYRANVPSDALARIGPALAALPEVRMCAATTSQHNLVVNGWVRSIPDTQRLEAHLTERFPELSVVDRSLTLANTKRMGWVLDEAGRAVRHVPIDLWQRPGAAT
ncbi:Lrp/AsnC family transcriptional regulator [Streptomyces sp. AcE210]|uniref:Lrp/AsnC family transcriptional regulator n=1 Tax=Streptomyces sp. AcE210 TaxID=2292703 RepID=UPI000E30368B|nr:Lrp/AsnC family transcriptional regulator [Streptomyces sp. AcE210]RFC75393.1 Lrp/AsnC family transcriptional regulator [Streptomyces sp. AcE210]